MKRKTCVWLSTVIALGITQMSSALELRTYQFSGVDSRPFIYDSAWGLVVEMQLVGSFDLTLDAANGTAQLSNVNACAINTRLAPPRQNEIVPPDVLAQFDGQLFSNLWPVNLGSLTGRFNAPDLVNFDGPTKGIFLFNPPGSIRPGVTYSGNVQFVVGYNTAFQIKLVGESAIINAATTNYFTNDIPEYYLVNATATQIPEPGTAGIIIELGVLNLVGVRRRRSTSHNCV